MNIIYIVPVGGIGGAEKIAYSLARFFSRKNNVSMIFLKGPLDDFYNQDDGIKKYVLNMDGIKKIPETIFKIKRIFLKENPDIVHTHIFYSHVIARFLKPFFNYKLICSEHGSMTNFRNVPKYEKIVNLLLKKYSDFNTNVCQEAVDSYVESGFYTKNELFVAYNGIDDYFFKDFSDLSYLKNDFNFEIGEKIFLAVGRLYPEKNFEMLIRAFHKVVNEYNLACRLIIVGDGVSKNDLLNLVLDLKLSEKVIFTGKRSDIPQLMRFSHVYCLSSNFEGLPTVLIESAFSKLNIVSTQCCGVKEILGDYQGCVSIADIDAFAFNMYNSSINKDCLLVNQRYERAKELFSSEAMYKFWETKYNEIFKKK